MKVFFDTVGCRLNQAEIEHLLSLKVSKASIAKIVGCSRTALVSFLKRRGMTSRKKPARDD